MIMGKNLVDKWRGGIRWELRKAEYVEQVMMGDFWLLPSSQEQKSLKGKVQKGERSLKTTEGMKNSLGVTGLHKCHGI